MYHTLFIEDEDYLNLKGFLVLLGKLIYSIDQSKQEEELLLRFGKTFKPKNEGYALTTPTEKQMQIQIDGVSINNKPRADGRYQGYVTTEEGKKKYLYGRTYKEVAAKVKDFIERGQLPQKKHTKNNSPLFGEYVTQWIEIYKKPNLKPKSLFSLNYSIMPALRAFGNTPLDKISDDDVQKLLSSITAPRARSLCKQHLKAIFKKAVIKGMLKRNPCEAVEIRQHKSKHVMALTPEKQCTFFKAAKLSPYFLLYRFITATGLRIGEALALHRSDIDFEKNTVNVSKNVVFIKGERIEQETPKSEAGNRTVPVPNNICTELKSIKSELLFPYTYNAVSCNIKRLSKNIGFKVTLHVLRHTYATRLEEAGIPPKVKQYLMGHASLEMTQNTYTDVQIQYLEALSDKIRNLFEP